MALLNATSFAGFVLLLYLSSFVLLAILRIATGISIQRIGLSSLRHISYTPREGIRIDIRGLGLALHRPTFAQPTWISLRLTELCVVLDPEALSRKSTKNAKGAKPETEAQDESPSATPKKGRKSSRSQLWKKLTNIKEKVKRIHGKINWLRIFDVHALETSIEVVGVGSISVAQIAVGVHTRRKLLDRGRLFRHKKDPLGNQKPAEWSLHIRNVMLAVDGRDPVEVLDGMMLNIHGLLYQDRAGLRDISVAIKVGRLYLPVDDMLWFKHKAKAISTRSKVAAASDPMDGISLEDVFEELDQPGSREAAIVQTVADSKEFVSSILQSVQEIQLGMSFIRISKEITALRQANLPLIMNVVTHEIGIDLHRLDQNSPAHRMYFSRQDVAHQALAAMVSVSVSLDGDDDKTDKIMYIPMATMTIKTTLPAKTMSFTTERDASERNSNILFANLVVTSPSIDLTPRHLIQLLAITQTRGKRVSQPQRSQHRLISRLLPRSNIKMSVHEPVVRFVLPVADTSHKSPDDYDMIISAISSISLDVESSHSQTGELLYSLASSFRLVSHRLYYQSAAGVRHNLVTTDAMELKAQVSVSSEVLVVISGIVRSFAILMVRKEVSDGVYNIVRHFKRNVRLDKMHEEEPEQHTTFLRKIPSWLLEFHFEGTNCSVEAAGIDTAISKQTRGLALELESWTADYVAHRAEVQRRPISRRKRSASIHLDEPPASVTHLTPPSSPSNNHKAGGTDGRRLALHAKGLQGYIIESLEDWEAKPFMSVPRLEVAFSTSRDMQGSIFHINSAVRSIYIDFSLYRFYSIGIAGSVVKDAFMGPPRSDKHSESPTADASKAGPVASSQGRELVTIDVKAPYVQIKARLPSDPDLMLEFFELSSGRHRWSSPFVRCQLARLHARSPHVKFAWARIATLNAIRIDLRNAKRKVNSTNTYIEERSIEVMTDFIRLGVPHGLMMYKVFDNIVNTVKSIQQLSYRFKTRTNDYILSKGPEGPKHVPRVSVRTKALMFELEDDAFEYKLNNIYHTGRLEQRQRLARNAAFELKKRKLEEERYPRATSRRRPQSSRPTSRPVSPSDQRRSRSADSSSPHRRHRSRSRGRHGHHKHKIRYDKDGACAITGNAKLEPNEAWQKLQEHNARSWKKRIDTVLQSKDEAIKGLRRMFLGADDLPHDFETHETILGLPTRHGILTVVISDLHLVIDKPSFPMSELPNFLHEIGKGMPRDMKYSLLIPLNISLDMGEARFMLRDYPLNLLHIPAVKPGQSSRLPSWSLKTDFVIAEEFRTEQSLRHIIVDIVPKGQKHQDGSDIPSFSIDVRRTVSPVKTYSKPVIDINTSLPTTISWGTSYQPVIQDMMMIIEGFTKPEIDPSDRVGFWDKVRLSFHSRPIVTWKGDGDVQLRLKGSRDPYVVTGYGAGFVMCWRNNVQWAIHADDNPKNFMTVRSGEFLLAIPDYTSQALNKAEERGIGDGDSISTRSSHKNAAIFQKVIMKVSGNVQWTAGLVFERDVKNGHRSSHFEPHYNVVLRNPKFIPENMLKDYDAFRGFRSNHIHLSLSIAAPFDREWTSNKMSSSESYNSIHLSPRFFSHFYDWWSLFSGVMSLPVRQGPLWRGPEKTSKKFGRHLATIKYGILLSPLYIAHIYKHKDVEDYSENVVSATGLKLRLNSFVLDLHQRREYFDTLSKGKSEQTRTSAMKINKAELDFIHADLRAVAASISGTSIDEVKRADPETLAAYQEPVHNIDMSRFTIPDHDLSWIDMDDLVELDWILPAESNPETKILPLAFTPRFTYFRQNDHGHGIQGDQSRTSPFGDEDSHLCVMSRNHNDPREVQMSLITERLKALDQELDSHVRRMGESELKVVRDGDHNESLKDAHDDLIAQRHELESKKAFLQHGLDRLAVRSDPGEHQPKDETSDEKNSTNASTVSADSQNDLAVDMDGLYSAPQDEFASDFNNRFIIHNAQVKWNNSIRNTVLRYSHQVSQRRGFVYYMSRRAVKFIIDIVEEQSKRKAPKKAPTRTNSVNVPPISAASPTSEKDEDIIVQDRIEQLLKDGKRFVDAEAETDEQNKSVDDEAADAREKKTAEDFQPMNSYHVRLVAPQVQLQSDKNVKSVVLLTAKGMQLKVVAIMDKDRISDEISGLVQRRFALDMDGVQIFVSTQKKLSKYLHLYSGNKYGNAPGSSWPPWLAIEAMFDFQLDPFGFQRVIQKTSASLRYEKYNPLRLKYNEEVASTTDGRHKAHPRGESRIDHLWVDFPRLRASCDSDQYYSMYIIALDLLMYSEPLEKTRSERLEKILLATDFSDLRGAPEMAARLQERIRQLEEIKAHFQINSRSLDKQGWQDRCDLDQDLTNCEYELFFIMKAINTSQQRSDERKSSQSTGFLRWYLSASEIVWHLMRSKDEPLLEFQLGNAAYERIDNSDGSNHNAVEIERIRGWNLLPDALYPEIIGPFHDPTQKHIPEEDRKMLKVHWHMLEAIAGIPVVEQFKVTMYPLKVQLEQKLGKRLFEYIFPDVGSKDPDGTGFSPMLVKNMKPLEEEDDEESQEARQNLSPDVKMNHPSDGEMRSSSPGAIGRRLQPTYNFNTPDPSITNSGVSKKGHGFGNYHHLFRTTSHTKPLPAPEPSRKPSAGSLQSVSKQREGSNSSNNKDDDKSINGHREHHHHHRFGMKRQSSNSTLNNKSRKQSDDLSQMMSRASNYMTIAHIKLNSVVICLSYKGKGDRNLEDLHDFVFRLPTLEYRNKTWSNLDLALRLKKDVIRALISHTGAIIGNKFSHTRASKKQQERLREIAMGNTMIPNSDTLVNTPSVSSDQTSLYSVTHSNEASPRISFQSEASKSRNKNAPLLRSESWSSSPHRNNLDISSSTTGFARSNGHHDHHDNNRHSSSGTSTPHRRIMTSHGDEKFDPLGPISPPRPHTSWSSASGMPGRSLIKETIGRHFPGTDTIKGRVRFSSFTDRSDNHNKNSGEKDDGNNGNGTGTDDTGSDVEIGGGNGSVGGSGGNNGGVGSGFGTIRKKGGNGMSLKKKVLGKFTGGD